MKRRVGAVIGVLLFISLSALYISFFYNPNQGVRSIDKVEFWAYQIQGIDEVGAVQALADSHYDLLVIEPTRSDRESSDFDTLDVVSQLHSSSSGNFDSKIVIAYVDIGEAEDWRWYWNASWVAPTETTPGIPDYLVSPDPDGWEGNYPVEFWDESWKNIILYDEGSSIQQIIDDGFDGIYMDWIEAYDFEPVIAAAEDEGLDAQQEMVDFISEIREYCRAQNPEFLLIAQNALDISDDHPEYYGYIDGVAQEHILFDGIADTEWGEADSGDIRIPASGEEGYSTQWYTEKLNLYLAEDVPVFVVDYAMNETNIAESIDFARSHGYIGFVTQISLSQLPVLPPSPDFVLSNTILSVGSFRLSCAVRDIIR